MATSPPQPDSPQQLLIRCIAISQSRSEFWVEWIKSIGVQRMAEVGVYRGDFAAVILERCEGLTRYYMVDPWRHLNDWNKPANHEDSVLVDSSRKPKQRPTLLPPSE